MAPGGAPPKRRQTSTGGPSRGRDCLARWAPADMMAHGHRGTPLDFNGFNDSAASIRRTMDVINRAARSLPGLRRPARRAIGVALAASLALAPVAEAQAQSRGPSLIRDAEIE